MFAGIPEWCDALWKPSLTPLRGYRRLLSSRETMNVAMRVRSAAHASASKSNISIACSSKSAGMPFGLSGTSIVGERRVRGEREPPLELAHVRQVAIHALAVGARQVALQRGDLARHGVEQARELPLPRRALLGRAAVAEQALEHDARIGLHRQRRLRRQIRDRRAGFERELERRQRRLLADVPCRELIDRRRRGALTVGHAAQPALRRARVIRGRRRCADIGGRKPEAADDVQALAERLERLQDRC